jgi:hypothetical protein
MPTGVAQQELEQWIAESTAPDRVAALARTMYLSATLDNSGNTAVLSIMDNILAAETEDDIFAAANAGTTSGKDYLDRPFLLPSENIDWKLSGAVFREQGNFPFYALFRAIDMGTGEEITVNCGGFSFVTTLWQLSALGHLDKYDADGGMPLVIRSKPAANGNVLLLHKYIVPVPPKPRAEKT